VISVSTIEHVGLGGYSDPEDNKGDFIAIGKLLEAVKFDGKLIISVPFGKPAVKRNQRIYNYEILHKLIPNIIDEKFFYKNIHYGYWKEIPYQQINDLVWENYDTISPCQAIAFVVAKKK